MTSSIGSSHHSIGHFNSKIHRIDGTKHFFNLANLGLVFKENRGIEVWDHGVGEFAHGFAFARVLEQSSLDDFCRRAFVSGESATPAESAAPASSEPASTTTVACMEEGKSIR